MYMCEKCQDRGFTEQEHGLIMVLCDCEKGKALREEITGEVEQAEEGGILTKEILQRASDEADKTLLQAPGTLPFSPQQIEGLEIASDSNSGTGQPDKSVGSKDTGQPKRTRKSKKKKGTRKRAS